MGNTKNRSRKLWQAVFTIFMAVILCAQPTFAISEEVLDFYASNNIMFYDPDATSSCGTTANCSIVGSTRNEKFWSGLRRVGFSPEETAAIMGNMLNEGGTPVTQEYAYSNARKNGCNTMEGDPYTIWTSGEHHHGNCMANYSSNYTPGNSVAGIGLGFIQWTSKDRREGYLAVMRDLGLLDKYFEGDAYLTYGYLTDEQLLEKIKSDTGSESEYWALWCAAIKYIHTELKDGSYAWILDGRTDVGSLAGRVAEYYEGCAGCKPGQGSYGKRVSDAQQVWTDYQSGAYASVEGGSASIEDPETAYSAGDEDGSNVTIIGDSITNGSYSKIIEKLPNADIHKQDSKQMLGNNSSNPTGEQIVNQLKASGTLRPIVVLALGTNSAGLTESALFPFLESIGNDHKIFLVTNYDDYTTNKYDQNNKVFQAAADVYDNVSVIDWAGAVKKAKSENPGTDYIKNEQPNYSVHPTDPAGTELFADTIYKGITGGNDNVSCADLDPGDPSSYMLQFIVDTNYLYGTNYKQPPVPAEHNVALGTPLDDSPVTPVSSHVDAVLAESKGVAGTSEGGGCWGATYCGQCTAMSGWFTSMMTDYNYGGGDGGTVAGNLITANPGAGLSISHEPKPFSVFSEGSSSAYGHTGVVLKVESDYVLTIENNINVHQLMIRERQFAGNAQFVDLSQQVHLGHLGKQW